MLVAAIPTQDWPRVVQELARVTRSGGWVELMEYPSLLVNAGPVMELLLKWVQDACLSRGIDFSKVEELGMLLTRVGLKQVMQQPIDIPLGAWDTQVGVLLERDAIGGFEGVKPLVCKQIHIAPA